MAGSELDQVLDKLAKDVETAVHALYRGEVRQMTAKARTDGILKQAKAAAAALTADALSHAPVAASPRPSVAAPAIAGELVGWTKEEGEAVLRCITAWLPVGSPRDTAPESKCIPAASMLLPTWGQREKARDAVKRITV